MGGSVGGSGQIASFTDVNDAMDEKSSNQFIGLTVIFTKPMDFYLP